MNIIGAGLSGLICGALNAQSHIYERNKSDFVSHRAVLRFRDDKIAKSLGLTFRKVTVRKAIWANGNEVAPSPRWANLYSDKVRAVLTDNSIWNIAPSERFIAPDDLHGTLAEICGNRVSWGVDVTAGLLAELCEQSAPLISTIPLPYLLKLLDWTAPFNFRYETILVDRFSVEDCDLFQTIYFPEPDLDIYRATLTGNLLTIEAATDVAPIRDWEIDVVKAAFGFDWVDLQPVLSNHRQSFGKIAPVPEGPRKALLHALTLTTGVYSLGRFATWRNILLDDIYDDIAVIRKMIAQSHYDKALARIQ